MKQIYYILASLFLVLCLSFNCNAQTNSDSTAKTNEIFNVVEVEPEFPGGEEARIRFLQDNVVYPTTARENNIQGLVLVGFVVETDGSISNVEILRSVHKSLDEEAVRVTKLMPKWKPGTHRGKPVRVQYNMPIRFTLENDDNTPSKAGKKKK